jgi:MFS family permease
MMLFSGLALGSDGYNAAVMSNLNLMLTVIYPDMLSSGMKARLSNAFLIGMIVGMVGFGVVVDQIGRKTGAVLTTLILLLGIALSAFASGTSPIGMFWMLVVARGIAGVGAGGEYPVAGMSSQVLPFPNVKLTPLGAGALEASDKSGHFRKRRGFLFAMVADLAAGLGYCFGALVPLLLLLCIDQRVDKYHVGWRTALYLLLSHAYENLNRLPEVGTSQAEDALRTDRKEVLSTDSRCRS